MSNPSKGTLIVHNGSGKVVGVEPGNDNEILVYDSTQPLGVKKTSNPGLAKKYVRANKARNQNAPNNTYTTLYAFIYPGADVGTLEKISVISYMDAGPTSYDIQIYDVTHSNAIATQNFSNTTPAINTITSFSNIPNSDSIIEVRAKKNGVSVLTNVYVEDLNVVYI